MRGSYVNSCSNSYVIKAKKVGKFEKTQWKSLSINHILSQKLIRNDIYWMNRFQVNFTILDLFPINWTILKMLSNLSPLKNQWHFWLCVLDICSCVCCYHYEPLVCWKCVLCSKSTLTTNQWEIFFLVVSEQFKLIIRYEVKIDFYIQYYYRMKAKKNVVHSEYAMWYVSLVLSSNNVLKF